MLKLTFILCVHSLFVSSTCRDYCNILAKYGPRGQGGVPGGGAGKGYAGSQWGVLLLHHGHCQSDWCQRQWTHIPAPWVTYMNHNDANTRPHTQTHSRNQWNKVLQTSRTRLILYLGSIYLITLLRFGWVVCAASAALGCTRLVTQPAAKIKRKRWTNERERERYSELKREREVGIFCSSGCARVHASSIGWI